MLSGGWAQGEKSRARFCSQLWLTHMVFALASLAGPPCPGRRKQALMEGSCGQAASSICSANSIKGLRRACPAPKAMAIHLGAKPPRSRVPVARVYKLGRSPSPSLEYNFLAAALETSPQLESPPTPGLLWSSGRRSDT